MEGTGPLAIPCFYATTTFADDCLFMFFIMLQQRRRCCGQRHLAPQLLTRPAVLAAALPSCRNSS
jgi:hypothetical protein